MTKLTTGALLQHWRKKHRLSQAELSLLAGVSTRHVSFLETNRSKPSREMLTHLARHLQLSHRNTNQLLTTAGFSPAYQKRSLDDPELAAVRETLQQLLDAHQPFPALVVDRDWNLVLANGAVSLFTELVDVKLLQPPVNVLRLVFHPEGLAPHIVNSSEVFGHLLRPLERQLTFDDIPALKALHNELLSYAADLPQQSDADNDVMVPLRIRRDQQELAFFTTIATFGTPVDVTVSELLIEQFFPADATTRRALQTLNADLKSSPPVN